MILPLLDYGDVFYQSTTQKGLDKLKMLQNRAIRIVAGLRKREPIDEEYRRMNIVPLVNRRFLHLLQHGRWIAKSGRLVDNRGLSTRSHVSGRSILKIEAPKSERYRRSFIYRACKVWNSLHTNLHQIVDDELFKKTVVNLLQQGELKPELYL